MQTDATEQMWENKKHKVHKIGLEGREANTEAIEELRWKALVDGAVETRHSAHCAARLDKCAEEPSSFFLCHLNYNISEYWSVVCSVI